MFFSVAQHRIESRAKVIEKGNYIVLLVEEIYGLEVHARVGKNLNDMPDDSSKLSCRFTHVYPDGPAPYYTFSGIFPIGSEMEAWREIKNVANQVLIDCGGTITHHHAVGRLHKNAWEQQRPELFGTMLRAANLRSTHSDYSTQVF